MHAMCRRICPGLLSIELVRGVSMKGRKKEEEVGIKGLVGWKKSRGEKIARKKDSSRAEWHIIHL